MSSEPKPARADLENALEEALRERNRLWAELGEERADQRELEDLRAELNAIHSSALWRLACRYGRIKQLARIGLERLRKG